MWGGKFPHIITGIRSHICSMSSVDHWTPWGTGIQPWTWQEAVLWWTLPNGAWGGAGQANGNSDVHGAHCPALRVRESFGMWLEWDLMDERVTSEMYFFWRIAHLLFSCCRTFGEFGDQDNAIFFPFLLQFDDNIAILFLKRKYLIYMVKQK